MPMKFMMLEEFGSTSAVEMSAFQRLLLPWKGTKPFKLVSCPGVMPAQVPGDCADTMVIESTASKRVFIVIPRLKHQSRSSVDRSGGKYHRGNLCREAYIWSGSRGLRSAVCGNYGDSAGRFSIFEGLPKPCLESPLTRRAGKSAAWRN